MLQRCMKSCAGIENSSPPCTHAGRQRTVLWNLVLLSIATLYGQIPKKSCDCSYIAWVQHPPQEKCSTQTVASSGLAHNAHGPLSCHNKPLGS